MLMVNLADLCNDKNRLAFEMQKLMDEFSKKYQLRPGQVTLEYTVGGDVLIKIIVT